LIHVAHARRRAVLQDGPHVVCVDAGERDRLAATLQPVFDFLDVDVVVRDASTAPSTTGDVSIGATDAFASDGEEGTTPEPPFGGARLIVVLSGPGAPVPQTVRSLYPRVLDV
jgi:hypothetical protein